MMDSEQEYNNNNMKEIRDPKWILDRRNSGRLFWRRDSSGNLTCGSDTDDRRNHTSSMNRVKFRCDVEVLEFWQQDYERMSSSSSSSSDEYSDEDECYGFRGGRRDKWRGKQPWRSKQDEDVATPSTLIVGFLLALLLVLVFYQWMNEQASVAV